MLTNSCVFFLPSMMAIDANIALKQLHHYWHVLPCDLFYSFPNANMFCVYLIPLLPAALLPGGWSDVGAMWRVGVSDGVCSDGLEVRQRAAPVGHGEPQRHPRSLLLHAGQTLQYCTEASPASAQQSQRNASEVRPLSIFHITAQPPPPPKSDSQGVLRCDVMKNSWSLTAVFQVV